MRISLAGSIERLDPIVILFDIPGSYIDGFDPSLYLGYVYYDVIAIAGGGGDGGAAFGTDPNTSKSSWSFGGAGGGAGYHRRKGLLSILNAPIDIVVGAAGVKGTDGINQVVSTDGTDGESSSFGAITMATGGKRGLRSQLKYPDPTGAGNPNYRASSYANGGAGGIGGLTTPAGGGALGGIAGSWDWQTLPNQPAIWEAETVGRDGKLTKGATGDIGQGGGGGAGGNIEDLGAQVNGLFPPTATAGGKGSYDTDELVFSPGTDPENYNLSGINYLAKPGHAGGAKITLFNGSNARYGDSGKPGIVAIRLSVD